MSYPPGFPYRGTVIEGIWKNEQLLPVLLVATVQVADWWARHQPHEAEKLRLDRYLREAYTTVERVTDAMQYSGFWNNPELYTYIASLKQLLDRLAPTGLYFGARKESMDDYGYWDDSTLVGPPPVWN
jgi:hypothetical protein